MANLVKSADETGYRARADRSIQSGRVVSVNKTSGTAVLDVGMVDQNGAHVYLIDVPFSPQTPPQPQDIVTILRTNSSPYSMLIGGGAAVGGANSGGVVETEGAVTTLAKSGSTGLQGDVTLTGSGGVTLTQTGQNIDINASGGTTAGGDLSGTYPNPTVAKIQGKAVSTTAPTDGQVLQWVAADSQYEPKTLSGGGGGTDTWVFKEIPSGSINSSNTVFVLLHAPSNSSEHVFRNGVLQASNGADYSISGNTITFRAAPLTNDKIVVTYQYASGGGSGSLADAAFYYKFETTAWLDSTAHANNATGFNGPTSVTAKIGNGVNFNGTNQYLSVPYSSSFDFSGAHTTVACWVYLAASPNDFGRVWARTLGDTTQVFGLYYHGGLFNVRVCNAAGTSVTGASATTFGTLANGTWYFVVVKANATTTAISVNGGAFDTAAISGGGGGPPKNTADGVFTVGVDDTSNANYFAGAVDSLGGWLRDLSSDEISTLYNASFGSDPF